MRIRDEVPTAIKPDVDRRTQFATRTTSSETVADVVPPVAKPKAPSMDPEADKQKLARASVQEPQPLNSFKQPEASSPSVKDRLNGFARMPRFRGGQKIVHGQPPVTAATVRTHRRNLESQANARQKAMDRGLE
jgi:hypothetical protein